MDANIQTGHYFGTTYEEYEYMHEQYDNYYDKTEKALLVTRRIANFWNKNVDCIFTDCLFVYEIMKCKLEVKLANKRERFNVLTYGFEVKDKRVKYLLSHADKCVDFNKLIELCMFETEDFRNKYKPNEAKDGSLDVLKKVHGNTFIANYVHEEFLEWKNYFSTFAVQQITINKNLSLHAVVNIREQFAIVIVHIDGASFLCDFSDYFYEPTGDFDNLRKYYFLEVVDNDFDFYNDMKNEDWRTEESHYKEVTKPLYELFSVFESELQMEIPLARPTIKTHVIKF